VCVRALVYISKKLFIAMWAHTISRANFEISKK